MTDIATALTELGVTEWVLRGEPTSEAEFNEMFCKVTGSDENGSAIESSNPSDFGTTWSAVSAKKTELVNAEPMRLLRGVLLLVSQSAPLEEALSGYACARL